MKRFLIGIPTLLLIGILAFALVRLIRGLVTSGEIADWPPSIRDHFLGGDAVSIAHATPSSSNSTNAYIPKNDRWPSEVTACPFCGGPLATILSVAEDRARPCKNRKVFSYSSDSFIQSFPESPICTRCWAAYFARYGEWDLVLSDPKGFLPPLKDSLASIPLPSSDGLYSGSGFRRSLEEGFVEDSVRFFCADKADYLRSLAEYCEAKEDLYWQIRRGDRNGLRGGMVGVEISSPRVSLDSMATRSR